MNRPAPRGALWALLAGNFVIGTGVMVVPGTLNEISTSLAVTVATAGQLITVAAVKVIGAILVGALLVIPAAAARLLSQSLKGFFWCSVLIATVSTLCGILAPIVFDLPIPSGAAIILVSGIAFALAAIARGVVPSLKGNLG